MIDYFQEMSNALKRIAEGDLSVSVAVRSEKDIIGNAAVAMTKNLRELIKFYAVVYANKRARDSCDLNVETV